MSGKERSKQQEQSLRLPRYKSAGSDLLSNSAFSIFLCLVSGSGPFLFFACSGSGDV